MASDLVTACIALISQSDLAGLEDLLRDGEFDVLSLKDSRGYSALHIAALNSNSDVVELLLDHVIARSPDSSQSVVPEWVNRKTEEDFTALHFAAFRGNLVRAR